jgi:7,8-dihydropterin-6-yl-methyl-4-(beta-D-ribofuranosyl)aminobenzene 5'-phosphate synthase
MDNYVDLLLESTDMVKRPAIQEGNTISRDTLMAEHGLSLLVTTHTHGNAHSILLDTGHTQIGVPHNLKMLKRDLKDIEAIVMSHGHMDHTGGLYRLVEELPKPMDLVVHPWAFHSPRMIQAPNGTLSYFPDTLIIDELESNGFRVHESETPLPLAQGTILVTGQIDRTTPFEKGFPPAKTMRNGDLVSDAIDDDQALIVNLKNRGLVVISGCAHAGIINTIQYARKLTGIDTIHAILGGFHLTGPYFQSILGDTAAALADMNPAVVVPMHCTGWQAINLIARTLPDAFILNSVGSTYTLG